MTDIATLLESMVHDLGVFADIGTEPPTIETGRDTEFVRLIRDGETTTIKLNRDGSLLETFGEKAIKHASFKALLASERFGNLRDWSAKQSAYVAQEFGVESNLLEIHGILNSGASSVDIEEINRLLASSQKADSTRVLLIDGPAGIGKTQFIANLAARRVERYTAERQPLILHVQSRGRTLSYLYDLMAFSLQRLRLNVTFDQVPVLAKHGLITIAIDGFDELADPDGYDLAWSQVGELVKLLRGSGTLILAGRETFIGRDRILKDIPSLSEDSDEISVLTLQPPTKAAAIKWLRSQGWTSSQVDAIEDFLEPSSMALRPFFLRTLSTPDIAERVSKSTSTSILSILMEAMLDREVTKFGQAIEAELSADERKAFLRSLACEVARDMTENSSTSISDATLSWLVEVALPKQTSNEVTRILKARVQAIAFLTNDDRNNHRRFFHEKFYEYFLAIALIGVISRKEAGKVLSRSLFGSSVLETFSDVLVSAIHPDEIREFLRSAITLIQEYPPIDRTRKNLAAFVIACLSTADLLEDFVIAGVDVDEARFTGTASGGQLKSVIVNQFDCRGGDLTAVVFNETTILTLIADRDTRLPNSFPTPIRVQDISAHGGTLSAPPEVELWVREHLGNPPEEETGLIPSDLRDHPAIKLLMKACRIRQYWLRRGDDLYGEKILESDYWPILQDSLSKHSLLRMETRQASGTDAAFVHIRNSDDILSENASNPDVRTMFGYLVSQISS